MFKYVVDLT